MAQFIDLNAKPRDPAKNQGTGTRVSRRLRQAGRIPGIVYGHAQTPQPVHVARDEFWGLFKVGSPLVRLHIEGAADPETCLVRDVQWDYLGKDVIHIDFGRVDTTETVHQVVPIELKGDAPGVSQGGMLEHLVHEIPITCPAVLIPEAILADITKLEVGDAVYVKDLPLPEGAKADIDPNRMIVHVTRRTGGGPQAAESESESVPE